MPDRYGENPDADPDIARITDPYIVANCELCDEHGYRGGTICDHFDWSQSAKRGMQMIRESMGWQNPQDSQKHATHPLTPDPP